MGPVSRLPVNRIGPFQGNTPPVWRIGHKAKRAGASDVAGPFPRTAPAPVTPTEGRYFVSLRLVRSHPFARRALRIRDFHVVHLGRKFLAAGHRVAVAAGGG